MTIPDKAPPPGYEYALPGPLRTAKPFNTAGPFKSHLDALHYACPVLMSLPGAIAKRQSTVIRHGSFIEQRSWDDATEYCAWIYQTPDGAYELSWIATNEVQERSGYRTCDMPRRVLDARYDTDPDLPPDRHITYVFLIHSHPTASILTRYDIGYVVKLGRRIQEGKYDKPSCDGFFQYTLSLSEIQGSTNKIQKWARNNAGEWRMEEVALARHEYPLEAQEPSIKIIDLEQR